MLHLKLSLCYAVLYLLMLYYAISDFATYILYMCVCDVYTDFGPKV